MSALGDFFAKARRILAPGSRGGKFYITKNWQIRYGTPPEAVRRRGDDRPDLVLRKLQRSIENDERLIEVNSPGYGDAGNSEYSRRMLADATARRDRYLAILPEVQAAAAAFTPPKPEEEKFWYSSLGAWLTRSEAEAKLAKKNAETQAARAADPKVGEKWERKARRHFGLTNDPREAGYVLRDGAMLDFSGKREGGSPGTRAADHREIGFADEDSPGGTEGMRDFMAKTGAIRLMCSVAPNWKGEQLGSLAVDFPPQGATQAQLRRLRRIADEYDLGMFYYDFRGDGGELPIMQLGRFSEARAAEWTQPDDDDLAKAADPREPGKIKRRAGNYLGVDKRGRIHWLHPQPPAVEAGQGDLFAPRPEPPAAPPAQSTPDEPVPFTVIDDEPTTPPEPEAPTKPVAGAVGDPDAVRRIVADEYPRAYQRAREVFQRDIPELPLRFSGRDNTRRFAFLRVRQGQPTYFQFNLGTLALDSEAGIRNTVGHEVAHHVERLVHDAACRCRDCSMDRVRRRRRSHHSAQWRETMAAMGYDPHRQDEVDTAKLPNQVAFHCNCRTHYVGKRKGQNILARMEKLARGERGGGYSVCTLCHTRLKPGVKPEGEGQVAEPGPESGFSAWFSGSKVVDEQGRPRVVYHATRRDFAVFQPGGGVAKGIDSIGVWFAETPRLANEVVSFYAKRREGAPQVMPVYLAIRNPLVVPTRALLEPNLIVASRGGEEWEKRTGGLDQAILRANERLKVEPAALAADIKRELTRQGYDGIFIHDDYGYGPAWIAFEPTQVKSAIGNAGTFDPADPDFAKARRVLAPGSRGGKYRITKHGEVRYDQEPEFDFSPKRVAEPPPPAPRKYDPVALAEAALAERLATLDRAARAKDRTAAAAVITARLDAIKAELLAVPATKTPVGPLYDEPDRALAVFVLANEADILDGTLRAIREPTWRTWRQSMKEWNRKPILVQKDEGRDAHLSVDGAAAPLGKDASTWGDHEWKPESVTAVRSALAAIPFTPREQTAVVLLPFLSLEVAGSNYNGVKGGAHEHYAMVYLDTSLDAANVTLHEVGHTIDGLVRNWYRRQVQGEPGRAEWEQMDETWSRWRAARDAIYPAERNRQFKQEGGNWGGEFELFPEYFADAFGHGRSHALAHESCGNVPRLTPEEAERLRAWVMEKAA